MGCINNNEVIQSKLNDCEQIKAHLLKETEINEEILNKSQNYIHTNLKDEDLNISNKTLFNYKPKDSKVAKTDIKENINNLNDNFSENAKTNIDYDWIINKEFEEEYNIIKVTKKINEKNEDFLIQSKKDPSIYRLLNKLSNPQKSIIEELKSLKTINNKYIVKFYEIYKAKKNYYYVTDYCKIGPLYNKLQNNILASITYSEKQIKYLSYQLFQAIKYLNTLKFIHGNINPSNILISDTSKNVNNEELYDIKLLLNFNSSRQSKISKNFPYYKSPDFIDKIYDGTCDIWSVGVIMYQMFYNDLPFTGNTKEEIIYQIQYTPFSIPTNKQISTSFKSLLLSIFNKNPKERITIDQCINHSWFTSIDIYYDINHSGSFSFANFIEVSGFKNDLKQRVSSIFDENEVDDKSNFNKCSNRSSLAFHNSNMRSNSKSSNELFQNNFDKHGSYCMNETNKSSLKSSQSFNSIGIKNIFNNRLKLNSSFNQVNVNKIACKNMENINNVNNISSNIEDNSYRSNGQNFSELVNETIKFITYYIKIRYEMEKEKEKLNNIYFNIVSSIKKNNKNQKHNHNNINNQRKNTNNNMNGNEESVILTWENVFSGILNYIKKKRLSFDFLSAKISIMASEKSNQKKSYSKEEFYDLLIKYKMFYIEENLKKSFDLLPKTNVDEFLSNFSDILKMPYNKLKIFFEDIIKTMQNNSSKEKYSYEEYKELVINVVNNIKIKEGELNQNNNKNHSFLNFLDINKQENYAKDVNEINNNHNNHLNLNINESDKTIITNKKELNNNENNNDNNNDKENKSIYNKSDGLNISTHAVECFNEIKDDGLKEIEIHKMMNEDLSNDKNKENKEDNKENEINKNEENNDNDEFKYDPERFLSIIGIK